MLLFWHHINKAFFLNTRRMLTPVANNFAEMFLQTVVKDSRKTSSWELDSLIDI